MHDTLTVGIPILVILFGTFWNHSATDKLEKRMEDRFDRIETKLDRMQADISIFNRELGRHDFEIGSLKDRVK